jgi:hypothetical protein
MPRGLRTLSTLLAVLTIGLGTAQAASAAKPRVGISDQNVSTFSDPLFAPLGLRYARYVTPWNVSLDPSSLSALALDAWLQAATAAGVQPMVVFEHSAGDHCPHDPCKLPSEPEFTAAFKAFRAKYPQIKVLSVWNEANHSTQPTYKDPIMAAQYYAIVKRNCRGCTVVAADVLDNTIQGRWLSTFSSVARGARLWGLHNWGDVNHFEKSGLETMLETVKGDVWLTETGGIVAFTTADGRRSFRPSPQRAVKAMDYLFKKIIPSSRRIKRVYVYNWHSQPTNRWDSGLMNNDGTKRGVYDVVQKYVRSNSR